MKKALVFSAGELQTIATALIDLGNQTEKEATSGNDKDRAKRYFSAGNEIRYLISYENTCIDKATTIVFDPEELKDIAGALMAASYKAEYEAYLAGLRAEDAEAGDLRNSEQSKKVILETQARELRSMAETVKEYAEDNI